MLFLVKYNILVIKNFKQHYPDNQDIFKYVL